MIGRISSLAAATAVILTASPALASSENPVGGQGGMWTQEAPTMYFNTQMGAVLPMGVQYYSTGAALGGPGTPTTINYMRGLGGGAEMGLGFGAGFNTPGAFNAGLNAAYKQQFTRAGNMAMAFRLGAGLTGIGAGTVGIGANAGLPMTFDMGASLLSLYPGVWLPNLAAGTAGATAGAAIGLQAPLANYWSFIGDVTPMVGLGGGAFTFPVTVGARLSPTALSHVDFTFGTIPSVSPFTLGVGTFGVTGHIGFR